MSDIHPRRRGGFIEHTLEGLRSAMERAIYAEASASRTGVLQRLDPRVKVAGILALIVSVALAAKLWLIAAVLVLAVALASVLVLDPAVLLLDEPTAALDPRSQSEVIDLMVEWGGGSKSVITATHDLGHLEDIADRCYVLDGGKLVAEGRPADILVNTGLLRRTNLIHAHRHGLFRGQAT